MSNFAQILDKPSSEVEKPKPAPMGDYLFLIDGRHKEDKSSKKGTPYVEWFVKAIQPLESVDQEALQEWLTRGDGSTKTVSDIKLKATYYLTEDSIWRLKEFLEHLGIEADDKSLRQMLDEAPGRQFVGTIRHESSEDGTSTFAKLGKTAAMPD